jgi:hypothetical protein
VSAPRLTVAIKRLASIVGTARAMMSGPESLRLGLSGISPAERKQMEDDRLARVNAKKRQAEDENEVSQNKRVKGSASESSSSITTTSSKQQDMSVETQNDVIIVDVDDDDDETAGTASTSPVPFLQKLLSTRSQPLPRSNSGLQYPDGAFRRTWALGHARRDDDIKIEEVLQKNTLNIAVISSWQWDFDWLVEKFRIGKTRFYFVMEARHEAAVGAAASLVLNVRMRY